VQFDEIKKVVSKLPLVSFISLQQTLSAFFGNLFVFHAVHMVQSAVLLCYCLSVYLSC